MITITRRLAGQMRVVFRKALNLTRGSGPALHFTTGPDGIRVRARLGDAAVEYHGPGGHRPCGRVTLQNPPHEQEDTNNIREERMDVLIWLVLLGLIVTVHASGRSDGVVWCARWDWMAAVR